MFNNEWVWIKKSWTMWFAFALTLCPVFDTVVPFLPDDMKNTPAFIIIAISVALLRLKTEVQKDQ